MIEKQLFFRLIKSDPFKGIVSGVLTAEEVDRDKEILDYAKSKPFFEQWSDSVYKDSRGLSYGNVRMNHAPEKPVGRLIEPLKFDDANKTISATAEVIDPTAKEMVEKAAIVGFSIGGAYVSKTPLANGVTRYVANPCEVSVVDRPCLPEAVFSLVKRFGGSMNKAGTDYDATGTVIEHLDSIAKSCATHKAAHDRLTRSATTLASVGKALHTALDNPSTTKADLKELTLMHKAASESHRLASLDHAGAHSKHHDTVASACKSLRKLVGGGSGSIITHPASVEPQPGLKALAAKDPFRALEKAANESNLAKIAKGDTPRVSPHEVNSLGTEVRKRQFPSFFERQTEAALGKKN